MDRAPHHRPDDIAALARAFGERSDISARSVLVTVFGDSVVPAGGEVWLGELIELCRPFGFNDRLIRTSMFRLSGEGWFDVERVGRRSRYRLTGTAIDEFAAAEARIYHLPRPSWDGSWTLAFVDADDRARREEQAGRLRRAGFVELAPTVLGVPRVETPEVVRRRAGAAIAVATARFDRPDDLPGGAGAGDHFGLEAVATRYREVLDCYGWTAEDDLPLADDEAFLVRTMLVHELRRARLGDPDLPTELWPASWPAPDAMRLAGAAYRRLSPGSWRWLRRTSGLAHGCRTPDRFVGV